MEDLKLLTYCVKVRPLVLSSIRGVGESLPAVWGWASVRPLPCVGSDVDLQVLQTGEGFATTRVLGNRRSL